VATRVQNAQINFFLNNFILMLHDIYVRLMPQCINISYMSLLVFGWNGLNHIFYHNFVRLYKRPENLL